ncbi:MAG: phosphate ABC transporter substrate-binding protein PstS [Cyanobacteria bacterium P01_H01_bin.153]
MLQKLTEQIDLKKALALALVAGLAACGGGTTTTDTTEGAADGTETAAADGSAAGEKIFEENVALTGAGASFPAPLYQNWFTQLNGKVPELQVNYQSVGSGAGVEQFTANTVNFGASDVAMSDEEIQAVEDGTLLLPMTAGAIVLAYNLPGVEELNLTRDAYTNILLGNITTWNDPAIADANPDVELPDTAITVVHRSDGSGTTGVFTKHLSAISSDWESQIGEGKTVEWPTTGNFIGAKGNEGITAQLQQTEGAIGYIEYGYAVNNEVTIAALENASGSFVTPSGESASKTLEAVELPENLRAFITDPEGADSYPVVTYTWLLAYESYDDPQLAKAVEVMIEYGLNEGQESAPELGYIALPDNVRERVAEAADVISDEYDITIN